MVAINRRTLAITLILFAVGLSSLKVVDRYADTYIDEAIAAAAISYATARALNALVSMAQSSHVEAGIGVVSGSVTIGELLDPVNDLVERFSAIMTLALASLAAQKILLLIASHDLFLALLALFGLASALAIHLGRGAALGAVIRAFLVLVFVRFALAIAVSLNGAVDRLFLEPGTREHDARIAEFRHNLLADGEPAAADGERRVAAGAPDLVERVRQSGIGFWRQLDLERLEQKVSDGIRSFMNLIALYLLKTVVFPLGFFFACTLAIRRLWALRW